STHHNPRLLIFNQLLMQDAALLKELCSQEAQITITPSGTLALLFLCSLKEGGRTPIEWPEGTLSIQWKVQMPSLTARLWRKMLRTLAGRPARPLSIAVVPLAEPVLLKDLERVLFSLASQPQPR
ncbi:MAG TPA: hypothetical protein VEP28_08010, partial [Rubrobacter sp.]|nr:hypothetical protein [Rubrobacter sp.]